MQQAAPQPPGLAGQPVIEVVRGSFSWKRDAEPLLRDISLAGLSVEGYLLVSRIPRLGFSDT